MILFIIFCTVPNLIKNVDQKCCLHFEYCTVQKMFQNDFIDCVLFNAQFIKNAYFYLLIFKVIKLCTIICSTICLLSV